jgi:hypothetical protein
MFILKFLLIAAAVTVALAIALMLVAYLVRVIQVLQSITAKLANARLLLLTVAEQTAPAPELIGKIGGNVTTLHTSVNGVARSLGLIK